MNSIRRGEPLHCRAAAHGAASLAVRLSGLASTAFALGMVAAPASLKQLGPRLRRCAFAVLVTACAWFLCAIAPSVASAATTITGTVSWTGTDTITGCGTEPLNGLPFCENDTYDYTGTLHLSLARDASGTWHDDGSSTVTATVHVDTDFNLQDPLPSYPTCCDSHLTADGTITAAPLSTVISDLQAHGYGDQVPPNPDWSLQNSSSAGTAYLELNPFVEVFPDTETATGGPPAMGAKPFGLLPAAVYNSLPYVPGGPPCNDNSEYFYICGTITSGSTATVPTVDFNHTYSATQSVPVSGQQGNGTDGYEVYTSDAMVTGIVGPNATPKAAFTFKAAGGKVDFDASNSTAVAPATVAGYEWDFGDGSGTSTTSPNVSHTYAKSGTYNVTLTVTDSQQQSSDPVSQQVNVLPPTASFTYKVRPGGTAEFDASASQPSASGGPAITNYHWDFGDGQTLDTSNPVLNTPGHEYEDITGQPTVTLTVTDASGISSVPTSQHLDLCAPDYAPRDGVEFAGLVACVEAVMNTESPRQILATMRQFYYGSESWSRTGPPQWDDIIPPSCSPSVDDPTGALQARSQKLYDTLRGLANNVNGEDLSHIFEPMEALECPTQSVSLTFAGIGLFTAKDPNYDLAGVGGDLGSGAAEWAYANLHTACASNPEPCDMGHYFGPTGLASFSDLYGDIDGIALHFYAAGVTPGSQCASPATVTWSTPLSSILKDYFSSVPQSAAIECFRAMMQLSNGSGTQLPDPAFVNRYPVSPAIYDSGKAYYAGHHPATYSTLDLLGTAPSFKQMLNAGATLITTRFADWLAGQ